MPSPPRQALHKVPPGRFSFGTGRPLGSLTEEAGTTSDLSTSLSGCEEMRQRCEDTTNTISVAWAGTLDAACVETAARP